MEKKMKKTLPVFLLILVFSLNACSPLTTATTPPPATVETALPTETDQPAANNQYSNSVFGFSFQFPSNWFGPEEYISEQTLRVEVGSDVVYPYGEKPETPSAVVNSYNVILQYAKNNQNPYMNDTYQTLLSLKDGESAAGARSLITRVRQVDVGRFTGFEYIFTLPDTAQTEHVYGREVVLLDSITQDLVTIMGQPNNVEISSGADWKEAYRAIDEANLPVFQLIIETLAID
jgi:hypothetical protein